MSGPPPLSYHDEKSALDPATEGADYAQWVAAFENAERHQMTTNVYGSTSRVSFVPSQDPLSIPGMYATRLGDDSLQPSPQYYHTGSERAVQIPQYPPIVPSSQPLQQHPILFSSKWTSDIRAGENSVYMPGDNASTDPSRPTSLPEYIPNALPSLPQQPFTFLHFSPLDYSSSASSFSSPGLTGVVASSSKVTSADESRHVSPLTSSCHASQAKDLPQARSEGKGHPKKRKRIEEPEDYAEDEAETNSGEPSFLLTRRPGACKHCKKSKMKCDFPPGENTCRRCKSSGRLCVVEGPKPQSQREELLAQIRTKDAIIESLLSRLNAQLQSQVYSVNQPGMPTFTSRAEDFDPGVWSDHLQSSAGSSQGLGSSAGTSHTTTESTEATSVTDNSRHVDDTAEKSVPDETVPIGLIANLSLSDAETAEEMNAEEMNDQDDSEGVLGWARKTYFKPGEPSVRPIIGVPGTSVEPASSTAVNPSPQMVQKNKLPDIVLYGLVTPSDVDKLFNIYFTFMNVHVDLLDPVLHTPTATFFKSPFLFSTICAIASRYYEEKPEMYPIAMHFAKHAAASALISGRTSVEIALAYMLLAYWTPPAKRWEEHRTWLYVGLGIRVAMDLNLHQVPPPKPTNERQEREQLNGVRMWMNCFILDRSISTYYGRPPTIKEDYVIRNVSKWYNSSQYNSPCDIGISAYCAMLQITTRFSEEIFSDPDAPTGLNKNVDFLEITKTYDDLLRKYVEEWKERYIKHADLTNPQTLFRRYLLPYVSSYARLVMWSFVFQQAFQRGMQPRDSIIIDKCFEHASTVINSMVQNLAPSGYMRFASEGHYNFASFTSSFLVKLLKPEFAKLFDHKQQRQIFELIEQLIQTFSSIEVATDDKHTPRQHARFLSALLSKYRKGFPPGTLVPRHADEGPTSSSNVAVGQAPTGPEQTTGGSGPSWQEYQESTTYVPDLPGPSLADFDTRMSFDDEFMGALEVFKNPGYWESMMMPGLHWPGPVGDQSGDPPSVQDSGTYG